MSSQAFFTEVQHVDPRVEFWSDPRRWPKEGQDHIFFGRAVHLVGKKLYNELWTGDEPSTVLRFPIHPHLNAATPPEDQQEGIRILYHCHQGYRDQADADARSGLPPPMPTTDQWMVAAAISRQISDDSWAAYNRFDQVLRLMAALFEGGYVTAALRGNEYGYPQSTEPGLWLNECSNAWFATCQIDPANAFSRIPIRTGGKWLYVDRDGLSLWLDLAFPATQTAFREKVDEPSKAASPKSEETPSAPAGPGDTSPDPQVHANDVFDLVAKPEVLKPADESAIAKRGSKGRRPSYDWTECDTEALRLAASEHAPKSVHALADAILAWCLDRWGEEPGKSHLRKRLTKLLAANGIELKSQLRRKKPAGLPAAR